MQLLKAVFVKTVVASRHCGIVENVTKQVSK